VRAGTPDVASVRGYTGTLSVNSQVELRREGMAGPWTQEIVVCKKMLFELRIKQSTRKEYKAGPAPLQHPRGIKAALLLEWLCTGTRTTDEGQTINPHTAVCGSRVERSLPDPGLGSGHGVLISSWREKIASDPGARATTSAS
jgi:hypothetical protein